MKNYTSKQIQEDFKYLREQLLEIHPNPFLNISKEELNNDLDSLVLKSENIDELTFYFELMKILSKIKRLSYKSKRDRKDTLRNKTPY